MSSPGGPHDQGAWQEQPQGYQQPSYGPPPQGYGPPPQGYGQASEGGGPPGYGTPPGWPKRSRGRVAIFVAIGCGLLLVVANVIGYFVRHEFSKDDNGGTAPAAAPVDPSSDPSSDPSAGPSSDPSAGPSAGPSYGVSPDGGAARVSEPVALTKKFVGYLHKDSNQKAAAALGCEGSKQLLPTAISLIVDESTDLKVGAAVVQEPGTTAYPMRMVKVAISGTLKYRPTTGWVWIQDIAGEPLCVRIMQSS